MLDPGKDEVQKVTFKVREKIASGANREEMEEWLDTLNLTTEERNAIDFALITDFAEIESKKYPFDMSFIWIGLGVVLIAAGVYLLYINPANKRLGWRILMIGGACVLFGFTRKYFK